MCLGLPHLRYIVTAAEHRSFRRAAAALNVTQPTLSKRIRELEDDLGVALFQRAVLNSLRRARMSWRAQGACSLSSKR
ncbi:MAG: LysR family transcriptional regulator [Pseudorhodoplanes sp.]|uniref:LysR family transcriptional regulator n=1 Tax=Pseudorhodoplanes sp. TaxID=1934341 RepID=UPI003D113F5D